jgi:hypothetical protein
MKLPEQEQQVHIEHGQIPATPEERAYQVVFRGIQREPDFQLPPDFASRVMARVGSRQQASARSEWIWLAVGAVFFVVVGLICVLITGYRPNLTFLSPVKGLLLLGALLSLVFHSVDRLWVRPAGR